MINSLPIAVAGNSGPVCEGNLLDLTSNGGTLYSWNGPGGFTDPLNQNIQFDPATVAQNGTYTVTVTDGNGCTATATTNAIINAIPVVNANSNAPLCTGNDINFSANGAATYNWVGPAGFNSLIQNPTITNASVGNNGIYTVTGTDAIGCSNSATININIFPNPTPLFNADILSGCAPLCVSMNDLSNVVGGTIASWNWTVEGQNPSSIQDPIFCFNNPGIFDAAISVTTSDGCTATIGFTDYITVNANPIAEFMYSPNVIYESEPTVSFTNLSSGGTNYIWNFGEGGTSILVDPTYTYADTGTFCVELIAINASSCADTVEHCLSVIPDFSIYIPNSFTPNLDEMNNVFMAYGNGIKSMDARIFDRWGEEIFSFNDINKGWPGTTQNGSFCPLGVYVYKITVTNFKGDVFDFLGQVNLIR